MKLACVICIVCLCMCAAPESDQARLSVITSIPPLAEFVEEIGKEMVAVEIMVPASASPHTYEPTPAQLRLVSKTHVFVKVGTAIEFELTWFDKLFSLNPHMVVCDASEGIMLIEGQHLHAAEHHDTDPHIWTSPRNAEKMAIAICSTLVAVDSPHRDYYVTNLRHYLSRLDSLDKEIARLLSQKKNTKFLVYHPAWSYFARDYGLEQVVIESEGKEPTARDVHRIIEYAKEHKITVVFASPQFNTQSAKAISREIQGEVILINPLEKNYIENMGTIAEALAKALE